jgi:acetylglutamate/LysW-gamma-L-alpha-aminoadipate kinase
MLTVIKLGGGAGIDRAAAARDLAEFISSGGRAIVVHGCSEAADRLGDALGAPARYVTSRAGVRSRYTDAAAMRVFALAAAEVNAELVQALQHLGVCAVGLTGVDGGLLRGPRKDVLPVREADGRQRVLRDDHTGRVERVNTALLRLLLDAGYTPVIAPLALAYSGEVVNVDGDRAAAAVASALGAATLVVLSNVPGLLADPHDERSLVRALGAGDLSGYEARVTGGMRRKLMAAREALGGGVERVVLADGRGARPLAAALADEGTVIA